MPVVVEITNQANLKKAKSLLGAESDSETLELALERVIEEFEAKNANDEAEEEDFDIDVHKLNRIPPKKIIKVRANFRIGGRGKPMRYDLSDYNFDEENQ